MRESWCSHDCAFNIIRTEKKKQFNKETKRLKESIKTVSDYTKELQEVFNKYIRTRDYFEPCISCKISLEEASEKYSHYTKGIWDAGHYKSRGAKKQLRFNMLNVNKQCKPCNASAGTFSSQEHVVSHGYEKNLIEKIGLERVQALNNNNDVKRYTKDYLIRAIAIFKRKTKTAEKRVKLRLE